MHHLETTRINRLLNWLGIALFIGFVGGTARLIYLIVQFGHHLAACAQVTA